ncbi:MAG: 2-C-methyl-D-erythritol 4-phosphate cytidylyltransferase, partial [Planctomycetota bacterium]
SARENGAALLAAPVRGTLKRWSADVSDAGCQTVDRSGMWEALTPQVFRIGLLVRAYQRWRGRPVTDDAQIVERSGHAVQIVQGSADNIKITRREDLALVAAKMLSEE